MLNSINGRQPSFQIVFSKEGSPKNLMVSARYREKVKKKNFEIPQEIPKSFETFQEYLSSNWHNWSNLRALPTASF
jgi:hypothetical protein